MLDFLRVKTVPTVSWSSPRPLNFFPALRTFVLLCVGLVLFGVGEALLINAGVGVSPWTVFSQGVANTSGLGIGMSTFFIGVGVLVLWIPLRQTPGLGTLLNIIIIAAVMEYHYRIFHRWQGLCRVLSKPCSACLLSVLGAGSTSSLTLGPGPRDGVMTGLQRVTGLPVALVRMSIELTVVGIGWSLGGVAGLGTLLFAVFIGPAVSIGLYLVGRLSKQRSL